MVTHHYPIFLHDDREYRLSEDHWLRLWEQLDPKPDGDHLVLSDPMHLMYLANFTVDPFSLGAGFRGYLIVRKDGHAKLLHDNRLPKSVEQAHVEDRRIVPWYDGQ